MAVGISLPKRTLNIDIWSEGNYVRRNILTFEQGFAILLFKMALLITLSLSSPLNIIRRYKYINAYSRERLKLKFDNKIVAEEIILYNN